MHSYNNRDKKAELNISVPKIPLYNNNLVIHMKQEAIGPYNRNLYSHTETRWLSAKTAHHAVAVLVPAGLLCVAA